MRSQDRSKPAAKVEPIIQAADDAPVIEGHVVGKKLSDKPRRTWFKRRKTKKADQPEPALYDDQRAVEVLGMTERMLNAKEGLSPLGELLVQETAREYLVRNREVFRP